MNRSKCRNSLVLGERLKVGDQELRDPGGGIKADSGWPEFRVRNKASKGR